ncbi:hypothetical protein D9M71_552780 [compost metagenome]
MHDTHEVFPGQLLKRRTWADDRSVVQQAVEAAEFTFDHGGQFVVLVGQGGFQVERDDHRLWVAGGFDFVVDVDQVGLGLAQQQDGRTVGGVGLGGGSADSATCAGNQDDPVLEQFWAGGIVKHG